LQWTHPFMLIFTPLLICFRHLTGLHTRKYAFDVLRFSRGNLHPPQHCTVNRSNLTGIRHQIKLPAVIFNKMPTVFNHSSFQYIRKAFCNLLAEYRPQKSIGDIHFSDHTVSVVIINQPAEPLIFFRKLIKSIQIIIKIQPVFTVALNLISAHTLIYKHLDIHAAAGRFTQLHQHFITAKPLRFINRIIDHSVQTVILMLHIIYSYSRTVRNVRFYIHHCLPLTVSPCRGSRPDANWILTESDSWGSIPFITWKWRCGISDAPLLPHWAIISPVSTVSPTSTRIELFLRWARSEYSLLSCSMMMALPSGTSRFIFSGSLS